MLVVVVASVAVTVPLARRGHGPPLTVPANGIGVLAPGGKAIDLGFALPAAPGNLVVGEQAVWVTSPEGHEVYRIDPATREITQTISVGGGAGGVAVGAGDVWVANALDGTVSRIDTGTNQPVQTIQVGADPTGVGYGEGSVWVANSTSGSISRIDPSSGNVLQTIGLGVQPFQVAVGERSVWVTSQSSNSVLRLDPISGDVTQRITVGGGPTSVVVGFGSIWVANSRDSTVSKIDPERGSVAATIPVGDGPSGLAVGVGGVWAANALAGTVVRVDPTAGRVVSSLTTGNRPGSLAVVEGRVWVGVRGAAQLGHRGGTLRVVTSYPFASMDPAVAWPEPPHQLMEYTYDTLVKFQAVGGTEGLQVVPDLAVALPEPTDGGRTYTFVLRPGLRYSNGAAVAPEDFRRALERAYELNSAVAASFSPLVGANTCSGSPQECDLSEGITVNDHSRTVSFHLADPDPDFLYKLASYFTAPIPARGADGEPIPGTGPYMIERFVPGHEAVFVRNPEFREWSRAAQPDGFPDRIEWTFGLSIQDMTSAVAAGRADMSAPVDAETAARFPSRVHVNQHLGTHWAFFNTAVPPFNDVRVRRALNFAVDRAAVASLIGAPAASSPTCQLLPPTMPGYRPYCPYTVNPSPSGTWLGPDLPRARKLIAASGTRGTAVTYWAHQDPTEILTGKYLVSLLRDLGYPATLRVVSDSEFGAVVDSPSMAQMGAQTWFADYPSPSNFFGPFLSCSTVTGEEHINVSKFCDPEIERLVKEAGALGFSDPVRAADLWARAERVVTDLAPLLPMVNLNSVEFVSARVGNYQFNPVWGLVLDQLWVN